MLNLLNTNSLSKIIYKFFNYVALAMLVFATFGLFQNQSMIVNAQTTSVDMKPGQSRTFSVSYQNRGDESLMTGAQLRIFIGRELVLNTASLRDNFNNAGSFAVSPTSTVSTTNTLWGYIINYLPRSANNSSSPSGTTGPADVEIPLGQSGVFTFEATLKSDVTSRFAVGTTISPSGNEGVRGTLLSTGVGNVPGEISIRILAPDECTNGGVNAPTCSCPTGQSEVSGQCTDIIDINNIGNCVATPTNLTIGQTASCNFPLISGATGNRFTLPTENIVGSISGATGASSNCTIVNNASSNVALQCSGIPSTGASAGVRDVLVKIGNDTPVVKGTITLTNSTTCPPGASGTFPSCSCPSGQSYNSSNNTCSTTNCSNGATNPPSCNQFPQIAKPDSDTIDNDGVGGDNEPEYTGISFNPNPSTVSQPITITTTGLVNNFSNQPYTGQCTTFISGNGFTYSKATNAVNGVCTITFNSNEVPTRAGNYVAYTVVPGPNNETLTTPSASISFVGGVFITPRTGGDWMSAGLIALSVISFGGAGVIYVLAGKKKMKI